MTKNELKSMLKKNAVRIRDYSSPRLQRLWILIKRKWRKFHLTKIFILSVLVIALGFSIYLAVLAKSANVNSLHAGLAQSTTIIDDSGEEAGTLYAQKGTFLSLIHI